MSERDVINKESIEKAAAEAADKPAAFDAKERLAYVKRTLVLIQQYKDERKTKAEIEERLPEFVEQYPHLFKEAMGSVDKTNLNMMIGLLEKMAGGSLNQHQASVIVGDRLLKKYYQPKE